MCARVFYSILRTGFIMERMQKWKKKIQINWVRTWMHTNFKKTTSTTNGKWNTHRTLWYRTACNGHTVKSSVHKYVIMIQVCGVRITRCEIMPRILTVALKIHTRTHILFLCAHFCALYRKLWIAVVAALTHTHTFSSHSLDRHNGNLVFIRLFILNQAKRTNFTT